MSRCNQVELAMAMSGNKGPAILDSASSSAPGSSPAPYAPRGQPVDAVHPVASSSRQPLAQRTLKQPMTLRVAESTARQSASASAGGAADKEEYFKALKRKAELARRVDKWMDKLMEEPVDRSQFQRAVSVQGILRSLWGCGLRRMSCEMLARMPTSRAVVGALQHWWSTKTERILTRSYPTCMQDSTARLSTSVT